MGREWAWVNSQAHNFMENTRLRYVSSKNVEDIVLFINSLPFKVEIKGAPVFAKDKWHQFFILPEVEGIKMENVQL